MPFPLRVFYRKRPRQMGAPCNYPPLHSPLVGQKLYGIDRSFHRLLPLVQQLPRGLLYIGHCGVYHSHTCHSCPSRSDSRPSRGHQESPRPWHFSRDTSRYLPHLRLSPRPIGKLLVPCRAGATIRSRFAKPRVSRASRCPCVGTQVYATS